jgi:rhodanese-related sulfurtransferase/biotin operon repressor
MTHRALKQRLYPLFARVGQALASERRLEILDLLAQAPRHVDALAAETEMSLANVSQHLQALRQVRLVDSDREGTRVIYRLAGPDVLALWLALRDVAESRLAEVGQLRREYAIEDAGEARPRGDVERLVADGRAVLLDVRPAMEYAHGHIAGALSIPLEELPERIATLPRDRPIVAYCRGAYCLFADEAVALLRRHGFEATRLEGGWPEWSSEGRPVS